MIRYILLKIKDILSRYTKNQEYIDTENKKYIDKIYILKRALTTEYRFVIQNITRFPENRLKLAIVKKNIDFIKSIENKQVITTPIKREIDKLIIKYVC